MTEIFGHRGASGCAPENTMEAFELAVSQNADGIELDVQLSKDGRVVVIHDETIDRVSDGKGFVRDYTLEELRRFSFHNQMAEYRRAEIPTLEEVLEAVRPAGIRVNIELKTGIFAYPGIEEKTAAIVERNHMEDRVIYSSFNHYSVQKILHLQPEAETAYLISDVMLDAEKYAVRTGVPALHPALYHMKMEHFPERCAQAGTKVRVWTVNEESDLGWLIGKNVDAVITNYPERAVRIREKLKTGRGKF